MNPGSAIFQRILHNPFAYTAFKSTEPWLEVRLGGEVVAGAEGFAGSWRLSDEWTVRGC